jgi:hypothetical protein
MTCTTNPANNADAARRSVNYLKQAGVDFIKVQSPVPRDAYFAIADEVKRQGLPFVGHVPELVRAVEASDAGQDSMMHKPLPDADSATQRT